MKIAGIFFEQVFNDAIEALRVSYKKMNPFCVPFATTNMGSAILAMDLVSQDTCCRKYRLLVRFSGILVIYIILSVNCRAGWAQITLFQLLVLQAISVS